MERLSMSRWEIWLANVPFEDIPESKVRPVLILDDSAFLIDCLKMTSQAPRSGEYLLQKWQEAGLRKPTCVRISKRLALDPSRIIKRLGTLHPTDILELTKRLSAFLP